MRCLIALAASLASSALAQPFQLIVTVSPPGSDPNPANWQPTLRIGVNGSGGTTFPLANIPKTEVFDPAGIAFRSASDLFVGNRHGNVLGQGSISRFTLSPDGATTTQTANFTAPGMIGVHELAYDATRDHLFAACVNNGVYRFRFDASGNPVLVGSFAPGRLARGIAVHPSGGYLYMTAASGTIFTFQLTGQSGVTELPATSIPGASNLHFFCVSPDARHLYASDIGSNKVFRFRLGALGELTLDQTITSQAAIDLAFSPDYTEMFVGNHFQGGITRYRAGAELNWTQSGTIATPSMGGFGTFVAPGCIADFNFDGAVDFFDYDDYVRCFEGQACPPGRDPDFNGDNALDFFDYDYFVQLFETGC
ncbi:MAG: beta-propeller fold lactonase family protein [Planctomycetota bacterium]